MTTPNSTSGFGSDDIMLELFGAEVDMHLPVLSEGLLALEKGRAGAKEIDSMMRAAHSIKGAARIVGNESAVRVAHILEDCFTFAKDGRIGLTSDAVDTLLQGVDTLQRVCSPQSDAATTEEFIQSVLGRIAALRDGTAALQPPKMSVPAATAVPASAGVSAVPPKSDAHSIMLPAVFDDSSVDSLRRELCELLERKAARIVVDFGRVERFTVAALSTLLSFAREAGGAQPMAAIEAARVAPPIRALFRIVGLDRAWTTHD